MSVVLLSLHLYSYDGRRRSISFNRSGLSIITGESKTGKSALIHIIDYCLGSDTCHVPEGIIRRKVAWYAVTMDSDGECLFVARKNPDQGRHSSSSIYVRADRTSIATPEAAELRQNTESDGLKALLSRYVGIEENLHIPPEDNSRDPLTANFSHARIYCFQDQSLIDNKNQLFFNQNDSFVAQAIRDTLPYFLGVVSRQELLNQRALAKLQRELRLLERQRDSEVSWQESAFDRAASLLAESREVGLIATTVRPTDTETAFRLLSEVLTKPSAPSERDELGGEELGELQVQQDAFRDALVDARNRLDEARVLGSTRTAYEQELVEQKARLSAVTLIPEISGASFRCPLCEQDVDHPNHLIGELRAELAQLSERISTMRGQNPRLQGYIAELTTQQAEIEGRLRDNQAQINAVIRENEVLRREQELSVRRSRVQGRISSFLDTRSEAQISDTDRQIRLISLQIERLRSELSGGNFEDRLATALFVLTEYMTAYSRDLALEHSEGRTRLDISRLTVVSDTPYGSIRLENMGSGDNWVGSHVLSHMALHRYFRQRERPVPGFLVLDQPSKAHYPPSESQLADREIKDDDRTAVIRLFRFIHDRSRDDGIQTIVVDHADEAEAWFQAAVVERWRDGELLVPDDWPEATR